MCKYENMSILTKTKLSIIYKAEYNDKFFIIKTSNINTQEHILNEAKILKNIGHDNVVKYIGEFYLNKKFYIIIEFIEGISLQDIDGITKDEMFHYLIQIVSVIEYIHSKGIIYMDIKPQNIIVTNEKVVFIDFGISKSLDDEIIYNFGSRNIMPSEQLDRNNVDERTDIYQIGKLMQYLTTKCRLYNHFENLIERCLMEDKKQRISNVYVLKNEVMKIYKKFILRYIRTYFIYALFSFSVLFGTYSKINKSINFLSVKVSNMKGENEDSIYLIEDAIKKEQLFMNHDEKRSIFMKLGIGILNSESITSLRRRISWSSQYIYENSKEFRNLILFINNEKVFDICEDVKKLYRMGILKKNSYLDIIREYRHLFITDYGVDKVSELLDYVSEDDLEKEKLERDIFVYE